MVRLVRLVRLVRVVAILALPLVAALGSSCRPLLDGGWEGTSRCNGDAFPLSAIFNESGDGEIDGTVYIEGIFGGFIAKGVIQNGERDPDDGSYSFNLESDNDETPDFDIEMEYNDDSGEELEGTVDILDNDGVAQDTCQLDLDRVSVND